MKWTLDEVAARCDGTAWGEATVTSVEIDSRRVTPGALFAAVHGERDDGHRYLDAAIAAGAVAVLTEAGRRQGHVGIEVADTLEALRALAEARRLELECPVVGITGSSGKTTTKDLTAAALGPGAFSSPRSYNNEYGVPLTILSAPDDCRALVVEVGSRGAGHIAHLASAIRPTVAIITNVGQAHLEMFGDIAGVAAAKWELVEALGAEGCAILPADDSELLGRCGTIEAGSITFGIEQGDVGAYGVELSDTGHPSFELRCDGTGVEVALPVPGRHQASNAAAAVAAAVAVGEPFADAARRIQDASVSPWRMEVTEARVDGGEVVVVNDAYNANPDSMMAALDTVAAMPGRHVAVLGKMYELGRRERDAHLAVGSRAASLGFTVIVVGDDPGIAEGAGPGSISVADADAALDSLGSLLRPGDVVLVKASRAAALDEVAVGIGGVKT